MDHVVFQGNPDPDGVFRDVNGNPVARQLPDGTLLINVDALPKHNPSANNDSDEPKICPAPEPDRKGPKPKDIAYQYYIAKIVNPEAPTPPGFGVVLLNPITGRYVYFDDCHHPTGVMVDAKGTGYERLMKWTNVWKGVLEDIDDQAQRQTEAAGGRPIIWFVAEKRVADAFQKFLERKGYHITVIWVSAP